MNQPIRSIGEIVERMALQDAFAGRSREAVLTGLGLADERVIAAYTEQYWNKPYLLAELLTDIPIWPCGHELRFLLGDARILMTKATGIRRLQFQAAERCLHRMIDAAAKLAEAGGTED